MKKLVVLLLVIALAGSLFAYNDLMVQAEKKVTNNGDVLKRQTREIPEYGFEVGLTDMATTFYDYMPGSYCSSPLRILSDGSAYAAFHGQETDSSKRRVFYSYITADGNVSTSKIGTDNIFEGYAGIAVDPETNNPFVAWHAEATAGYEVVFTYDMYQAYGPGYWKKPFVIIDSKTPSPLADDEFLWPYTYIGPSPVDGKRRVYVTANNNNKINTGPSENVLLAYADFDGNDVIDQSELDWTYTTVPKFDEWHAATEWIRPFKTMAVSEFDGRIAYMGYNTDEEAFVIYNDNYGEGDWTYKSEPLNISVTNPLKQDGTPQFVLDNDVPAKISFSHQNDGHFNAVFMEGGSKLWTPGALGLRGEENAEGKTVIWPYYIFPKAFNYDFTTDEFSFVDLDITGSPEGAATDGKPMLPWDLDEDGAVDEYYDNGGVKSETGWPCYFHEGDTSPFNENTFYLAKNEAKGWLVAVWMDGLKNKHAQAGEGYEDWNEVAEIAIAISSDNGANWEETIRLNSLENDELSGVKPAYVYPGDIVEDIGGGYGKLHLMMLDDNSFGSSIHQFGNADGGTMKYAALKIDFKDDASDNNETAPVLGMLAQNYPNPFNPTTTISFNLVEAGNVTLDVYNTKGQLVNTLVNNEVYTTGNHNVVWNGVDSRGKGLTSGVYFYKIKSGKFTSTKKMILLK